MCGRFTLRSSPEVIAEVFELAKQTPLKPHFNIAPSQSVAVVRQQPETHRRELVLLRWGLIPSWADDPSLGNRMTNARSETVATKPTFRKPFRARRCLVIADGFYEWQKLDGKKQPFYIRFKKDRPFGFAGLWERWEKEGPSIETCTILTTEANDLMKPIHDRMPVIIPPDHYERWLDSAIIHENELSAMLRPYDAQAMTAYPISTLVNNAKNDVAECIEPM